MTWYAEVLSKCGWVSRLDFHVEFCTRLCWEWGAPTSPAWKGQFPQMRDEAEAAWESLALEKQLSGAVAGEDWAGARCRVSLPPDTKGSLLSRSGCLDSLYPGSSCPHPPPTATRTHNCKGDQGDVTMATAPGLIVWLACG
jgi:hypothetical protein